MTSLVNMITVAPGRPFRAEQEWAVFMSRRGTSARGDGWVERHRDGFHTYARRRGVSGHERAVGTSPTLEGAAEQIAQHLYPQVGAWQILMLTDDGAAPRV
ncbi:hypothetical protein ACIGZJ_33320 [Kitasatospora sp. NPDC052868]|uniref:hypothetical protein n=1 Tax=Kitasatospora sp. NPDC052868 TaxID=3364060 RepID=UPI0037C9DF43